MNYKEATHKPDTSSKLSLDEEEADSITCRSSYDNYYSVHRFYDRSNGLFKITEMREAYSYLRTYTRRTRGTFRAMCNIRETQGLRTALHTAIYRFISRKRK